MHSSPLLEVKQLTLKTRHLNQVHLLLHNLTFSLYSNEIVALVGESGCGKSLTASAILGLLPKTYEASGAIYFNQQEIFPNQALLSEFRGTKIGLILQDPSLALNPVLPIGIQLIEGLRYHKKLSWKESREIGLNWLKKVGINHPIERMKQYPHQLSGGMKQRILIAMALICGPSLLIADEPTTGLDLTVQMQILDLLQTLKDEEKIGILMITHDLGVVSEFCQKVLVMSNGEIIESGLTDVVLTSPKHIYTQQLIESSFIKGSR